MKFLMFLLMIFPLVSLAEVYKWADESGKVHYGDAPIDKTTAEKVTIKVNSYESVTYDNVESRAGTDAKHVIMYSTSWCGYCKQARNYFKKKGVAYTEYDIEKDAQARKKYDLLGGRGVPVILVGKKRMNGFSVSGFERIYK